MRCTYIRYQLAIAQATCEKLKLEYLCNTLFFMDVLPYRALLHLLPIQLNKCAF